MKTLFKAIVLFLGISFCCGLAHASIFSQAKLLTTNKIYALWKKLQHWSKKEPTIDKEFIANHKDETK